MTDLTQEDIDAIFQIIAARFERKGPINFSKDDLKDKLINTIDKEIEKTVTDIRKKIIKAVDDQIDDNDAGFILSEIVLYKIANDIPIVDKK